MWYKRYIALPQNNAIPLEESRTTYTHLEGVPDDSVADGAVVGQDGTITRVAKGLDAELNELEASLASAPSPSALAGAADDVEASGTRQQQDEEHEEKSQLRQQQFKDDEANPALFLLHANTITACIGVATFFLLWIPIPFLHWTGWEVFALPPDGMAALAIVGVCLGGVVSRRVLSTSDTVVLWRLFTAPPTSSSSHPHIHRLTGSRLLLNHTPVLQCWLHDLAQSLGTGRDGESAGPRSGFFFCWADDVCGPP